jgi:hypothetical protein
MDQESQKRLDAIVAAGPDSISEADAGFLRARGSYLNEEQRTVFAAVLRGVAVEDAVAQQPADGDQTPEEKSAKASKSAK